MKPRYGILFVLFVGLIGGALYFLGRLYVDNRTLQERVQETEREVKEQQQEISTQRAQLEAVQNDPKAVERIARKHLRMSKGDETIYTFSTPNPHWQTDKVEQAVGSADVARRATP